MPVRGLSYFAKLYQKYIEQNRINIFSSSLKPLPFPQYFVFYNGPKEETDRKNCCSQMHFRNQWGSMRLAVGADVAEEYLAAYWKENIKAEQIITCENGG